MTVLIWVLAVLAALTALVCLTRVGVRIVLADGSVTVRVNVGLLRVRVYPVRERKPSRKRKRDLPADTRKGKKTFPKPAAEDIKDAARTLWPPLRTALSRTRRGLRMDPLRLSLTLGGLAEPADTAALYGRLHAGLWAVMPELEKRMDIPDPRLHIGVDFNAESAALEGEVGVTARIGTLARIGLGVGIPALRWLLRYQKKKKPAKKETSAATAA